MTVNDRDIREVAIYTGLSLMSKGYSVSPLKLQKLLYYEQAWFMVMGGRCNTLFPDVPQAWVNGPVYPTIYHTYKGKTANMCDHLKLSDFTDRRVDEAMEEYHHRIALPDEYVELIESVINLYGAKTQNQLIFMTHSERPWAETRGDLPPFERSEREIPLDVMCDYYTERHRRNMSKR
ncbi:MAG: DUF4065 domain-containing protein [Duncaniella sp.]|nr:DUF4065 domain-containing protein [Duncaniella sp.]